MNEKTVTYRVYRPAKETWASFDDPDRAIEHAKAQPKGFQSCVVKVTNEVIWQTETEE